MARHRNFQRNNFDDDDLDDDFDSLGTSVDDEHYMPMSPNSRSYLYQRKRTESGSVAADNLNISHCLDPRLAEVKEESSFIFPGDGDQSGLPDRLQDVTLQATPERPERPSSVGMVSRPSANNLTVGFKMPDVQGTPKSGQKKRYGGRSSLQAMPTDNSDQRNGARTLSKSPARSKDELRVATPPVPTNTPKRLQEKPKELKEVVNMVVVGHVDAGKSTLMGHLLFLLGNVNQRTMHKYKQESQKMGKASFHFAWVLDESEEERNRGVTMDIAKSRFETNGKEIILLDAPGHKDFIPNMISGATQADAALLIVNAGRGEFETGFNFGGQTREHTILLKSLGVGEVVVIVNKLDTVDWSEERFVEIQEKMKPFLKQSGYSGALFVPACGLEGDNLVKPVGRDHPLSQWYQGPTVLEVIGTFSTPTRSIQKPLRFCVSDVFKGLTSGISLGGKVETGALEVGDRVLILPNADVATVKSLCKEGGEEVSTVFAGDHCTVTLKELLDTVGTGHVLCHPESPVPTVTRFRARLLLFNLKVPITPGFPVAIHAHDAHETATILKLVSLLDKASGEIKKKKPRVLGRSESGVVEIQLERPLCLETYADYRELGRVTLRSAGSTIGTGVITKIL